MLKKVLGIGAIASFLMTGCILDGERVAYSNQETEIEVEYINSELEVLGKRSFTCKNTYIQTGWYNIYGYVRPNETRTQFFGHSAPAGPKKLAENDWVRKVTDRYGSEWANWRFAENAIVYKKKELVSTGKVLKHYKYSGKPCKKN